MPTKREVFIEIELMYPIKHYQKEVKKVALRRPSFEQFFDLDFSNGMAEMRKLIFRVSDLSIDEINALDLGDFWKISHALNTFVEVISKAQRLN